LLRQQLETIKETPPRLDREWEYFRNVRLPTRTSRASWRRRLPRNRDTACTTILRKKDAHVQLVFLGIEQSKNPARSAIAFAVDNCALLRRVIHET